MISKKLQKYQIIHKYDDDLSKGSPAKLGEVRVRSDGYFYIKTSNGWVKQAEERQRKKDQNKKLAAQAIAPNDTISIEDDEWVPPHAPKEVSSIAVINGNSILMGVRNDTKLWTTPGGKLDPGEDPISGAQRELFEEAGIQPPENLKYLKSERIVGFDGRPVNVHVFVCFGDFETTTENDPDDEVDKWEWFDIRKGLPDEVKARLHSPKNVVLKALGLIDF